MDYEKALKILVQHNAWRRDDHIPNSYKMQNPTDIGLALDVAIKLLSDTVGITIIPEKDNI